VAEIDRPDDASYVRGAKGGLDRRHAFRFMAGVGLAALIALTVVLTVQALDENGRLNRLHRNGVAVTATVTGCVAIASGTGITESGYRCKASFTLNGRPYVAVLAGTDALYPIGATVPAVADRNEPDNLSTSDALNTDHASWTAFIPPAIALLASLGSAAWLGRRLRHGRASESEGAP
jgi:hypothetical protein